MEMHQVRYFLAAAAELNFTKAAEKCNVSQPSLTRAIKQLEGELGGDLFRRERPQAQLTELGERMHPLMKQIYDGALGARSLASSIKSGELGSLRLALSNTVELDLLIPHINELRRLFARLELKLQRGTAAQVLELLKNGEAELAIASDLAEPWERLDRWPLFSESFHLVVDGRHDLASRSAVEMGDLREEPILRCSCSEHAEQTAILLRANNIDADDGHEIALGHDLILLLEAGLGVAILPGSTLIPATLARVAVNGMDLRRTVYIYGVAGRQRSAVASAILKMLRAADWSRYEN
jgi:DNA-binding transcriptional LysR family regulator